MSGHTHIHTYIHTHRTSTVTLAAHARRGLIIMCSDHFVNPRRACAARVTVVVLCVCICVCMCVHSYLPPHTLESQKRDTNGFCAIQGSF